MKKISRTEAKAIRAAQKAKMSLCITTAQAHNIKKHTAEACDNYSVGCPDCPLAGPSLMSGWTAGDVQKIIKAIQEQ